MAYTKKNVDSETPIVETKVEKKKFNPKDMIPCVDAVIFSFNHAFASVDGVTVPYFLLILSYTLIAAIPSNNVNIIFSIFQSPTNVLKNINGICAIKPNINNLL